MYCAGVWRVQGGVVKKIVGGGVMGVLPLVAKHLHSRDFRLPRDFARARWFIEGEPYAASSWLNFS